MSKYIDGVQQDSEGNPFEIHEEVMIETTEPVVEEPAPVVEQPKTTSTGLPAFKGKVIG